jgi:hypothetical protein
MYKDYNITQLTLPMETSVLIAMISMDLSETSNYMNMMIAQNVL